MTAPGQATGANLRGRGVLRVVIAPDSFKGSLDAPRVAQALARGLRSCPHPLWEQAEIECVPLADGGEGTAATLVNATGGKMVTKRVTGPLGHSVSAAFGILGDGETAVIEMAEASGLVLVPESKRDPGRTTSRGTGELMLAAIDAGCKKLLVAIGGSATNDGGVGMAEALGVQFLDANGSPIAPGGTSLLQLDRIDVSAIDPRLAEVQVTVACDVDNPLIGQDGASYVFSPQKGAGPALVEILEQGMSHYAEILLRDTLKDVAHVPGAGAAGGMGAGLLAFCQAELQPGFDIVSSAIGLAEKATGAQLILTGEGRIDGQTARGKVVSGVGALGKKLGVPVIAIAGTVAEEATSLVPGTVDALYPILPGPVALEKALSHAEQYVEQAGYRLACLLAVGSLLRSGGD